MDHKVIFVFTFTCFCSTTSLHQVGLRRNADVTLLLANRQDIRLLKLRSTEEANSTVLLGNQENVAWVDFMYRDQSIYYANINEQGQSQIHRLDLELDADLDLVPSPMGPRAVISKELGTVSGLACDWRNHKLYLIDLDRKVIEVSETDGSLRKVLVWRDLEKPRDVTLDPVHGYMFWVDWNPGSPKIERAGMDGTMRTAIVSRGLDMPYSLTLDYGSMKLFWTDTQLNSIHSCGYSGFSLHPVSVERSQQFVAITVFNEDLFWSDWLSSSIWAVEKEEGTEKRLIASYMNAPLDVRVFAEERQPLATPNPCDFDNGYCDSLCLLSPDQPFYSCACKTGIKIDKENGTCADYPEEFLIFAQRTSIHMVSLDTDAHIPQLITDEDVLGAVAVDYDHVDQHVYWSDYQKGTIERIKLDGTERQIVVAGNLEYPDGIAVDWVSRTLYWTDAGRDKIEVSRLDGTARRVIVFDGLDEPRAIIVDPERGYLYWSDWGDPSRIERAALDGRNRTTLINTPEGWPNGIAIDYKQGRIIWGTAKYRKIESANMEGSNRSVIVDNTRHIFGFSLGGDYIYWTDWSTQKIERAQKHTGIGREDIATLSDLMGLKVVTKDILAISNECATNNGGCSHVCIYNPKGISCLCPSNMELFREDKRTCIYPGPALVYWAENDIRKLSLEGNSGQVDTIIADAGKVGETDTDAREGRVYWTNPQLKTISRAFFNGTGQEIIIGVDVKEPWGLSVDWMARNLYFTDTGNAHIELCKLDGNNRKILIKDRLSGPRSIAVDPKNGYLFWTDWGNIPTIERSLLDGTERTMLAINCPSSYLAVDSEQRRIYWVVPDENRIESCDMSGKDKWLLLDKRLKKPTSISIFGNTLLFANSRRNAIESIDKRFGQNRTLVKDHQNDVTGFSVFHPSLQPFLFHNPCANNNGGCEIFCLVKPGEEEGTLTRVCQCPLNKYLNQDKRTCSDFSNYLIVSVHDRFHRIPINSAEGRDTILPIRLSSDEAVKALDFDPVDKMIYWIDATTKTIKRAPEFGSKVACQVRCLNSVVALYEPELFLGDFPGVRDFDPFDIVVDPYNRILIFSDETNNFIGFSNMERRNVTGTLYEEVDKRPRYMGFLPGKGRLYWTDSKPKSPKIMTSSLDTSDARVLYRLFGHPTAYTLNKDLQRMFWMDSVTHGIEICNVEERFRKGQILNCADMSISLWRKQTNGPTRRFVQDFQCGTSVENEMMGTATGLAVYQDDIYWIDKDSNIIASRDVYGRGEVTIFRENLVGLTAIKAISGTIRRSHPCFGGGGCSHLCVANDNNQAECICPKRLSLAEDGTTCEVPRSCTEDQFECMSGSVYCIPLIWRCDHLEECEDGSDEIGCEDGSQNGQ